MDKMYLNVKKEFCAECSLALRRFIGHMDGVKEVSAEEGKLVITFDSGTIEAAELFKISRESVEKLGYTVDD